MYQPTKPPAAEDSPQSVYDEILMALQEMMPEQGTKLRDLARSLSEEYMRERSQAFEEMRPKHPEAPMTEQMIVEQAYSDQKDQERREERMKRRLEDLQRKDAKGEMQASRPLRPPWSAQGITPSVQYDAPLGMARGSEARGDPGASESSYGQWLGTDPRTSYHGAIWVDNDGDGVHDYWQKGPGQADQNPIKNHPQYHQARRRPGGATASNQPSIPRMQGGNTAAHAMMLDRMQDPYADPAQLQRLRQSQAAAARSGGYPMPTQPSFGPIERTYRA
jgi:hypothetical protein